MQQDRDCLFSLLSDLNAALTAFQRTDHSRELTSESRTVCASNITKRDWFGSHSPSRQVTPANDPSSAVADLMSPWAVGLSAAYAPASCTCTAATPLSMVSLARRPSFLTPMAHSCAVVKIAHTSSAVAVKGFPVSRQNWTGSAAAGGRSIAGRQPRGADRMCL